MSNTDIDAVLITRYEGTNEETVFRPGTSYGMGYHNLNYWGYYDRFHHNIYQPGYYANYKYLYLETNVYSVAKGKMIWSARSETINPGNLASDFGELADAVIHGLRQGGIVSSR